MEIKIFIGDIDEFYSDAKEGNRRWAVWSNSMTAAKKKKFNLPTNTIRVRERLK